MSSNGIRLVDAYIGPAGVLTGTARMVQEAREMAETQRRLHETERRIREVARRRSAIERQMEELRASLEATEDEEEHLRVEDGLREADRAKERDRSPGSRAIDRDKGVPAVAVEERAITERGRIHARQFAEMLPQLLPRRRRLRLVGHGMDGNQAVR